MRTLKACEKYYHKLKACGRSKDHKNQHPRTAASLA